MVAVSKLPRVSQGPVRGGRLSAAETAPCARQGEAEGHWLTVISRYVRRLRRALVDGDEHRVWAASRALEDAIGAWEARQVGGASSAPGAAGASTGDVAGEASG